MAFHVGQKVACVDDFERAANEDNTITYPVKRKVYTVRSIKKGDFCDNYFITLVEIVNPSKRYFGGVEGEANFWAESFRPVVERKTSIAVFEAMLAPAKKAAETVGFLAFMAAVGIAVQFAQFWKLV